MPAMHSHTGPRPTKMRILLPMAAALLLVTHLAAAVQKRRGSSSWDTVPYFIHCEWYHPLCAFT